MRIPYVAPGPIDRTAAGREEMDRQSDVLRLYAAPDTGVDMADVEVLGKGEKTD